ncbi:hypothetical protein [Actinokineospora enzanensis]|uniref:hypothetical protein n=1 Tax=Actinokineospora enzanensis TaxID=155975 RepID=UPI00036BCAEB|nr:hypothetical protein [Actinokineospora enzanensis]
MKRELVTAPDVAEVLDPEALAQLAARGQEITSPCWSCKKPIPDDALATVSMLRLPAMGIYAPRQVPALAHPGCSPSRVIELTEKQAASLFSQYLPAQEKPEDDVDLRLTAFPLADADATYPVLLVSYHELATDPQAPEPVDSTIAYLLGSGYQLITGIDKQGAAQPGPGGVLLRYTAIDDTAGLAELINPAGVIETVAEVEPTEGWFRGVARTNRTVVMFGHRILDNWNQRGRRDVRRAARAGRLVGGIIPVMMLGQRHHVGP